MSDLAERIAAAILAHQQLPPFPEKLSLKQAYQLQSEVADLVAPDGFSGIKAGVTSEQLQTFFGIDHALLGRLYQHGHLKTGATLGYLPKQLIECEIGIMVNGLGQPVSAGLAIEFAFADFSAPGDATAPNLTACNVAADRFLTGEQFPWRESCEDIAIRLYRDGELINDAPIIESLGGPTQAIRWIVKEAKKYNLPITDNTLLMTGACGQVVAAKPGAYRVDCGEFGEVNFYISPPESG